MSRKAGFGVFALVICLVGGPWDGPPVRAFVTPIAPAPVLASAPLEPMPPVERPRVALQDDVQAEVVTRVATPEMRKATVVVRHQPVRVSHLPRKHGPRNAVRTTTGKPSTVARKPHYPYVRPRDWGPGYPAT